MSRNDDRDALVAEIKSLKAELLRAQDAKRRALELAGERSKDNVELRASLQNALALIKLLEMSCE